MSPSSMTMILFSVALLFLGQCRGDLVDDICSKSNNPSLCNQVLGKSRGADVRTLAKIAVAAAEKATTDAIAVAKAVSGSKEIIETCIENFDSALDNLNDCKALIPRGRSDDLNTRASAALTDVDTCSDEFGGKEPAALKKANDKAYSLVQLLLIITNKF